MSKLSGDVLREGISGEQQPLGFWLPGSVMEMGLPCPEAYNTCSCNVSITFVRNLGQHLGKVAVMFHPDGAQAGSSLIDFFLLLLRSS